MSARLFTATLLLSLFSCAARARADTELRVEGPLKFTYPAGSQEKSSFSFLVTATEPVSELRVGLRGLRSPNGVALTPDMLAVAKGPLTAWPEAPGAFWITLEATRSAFRASGEYQAALWLVAKEPPVAAANTGAGAGGTEPPNPPAKEKTIQSVLSLSIDHPAAEINLDELSNTTIWVTGDEATVPLRLRETSGKSDIDALVVDAGNIVRKDSKERARGKLSVAPTSAGDDPKTGAPGAKYEKKADEVKEPAVVPAGRSIELTLNLAEFEDRGELQSALWLSSPSFTSSKSIPLRINVRDCLFWPLLVIFVGVLGGTFAHWAAQNFRPRQKLLIDLARLRDGAFALQRLAASPAKRSQISELLALIAVGQANAQGSGSSLTQAEATAKKAQELLDELVKAERAQRAKSYETSAARERAFKALERALEAVRGAKPDLAPLWQKLAEANALLSEGKLDAADVLLAELEGEIDRLKRELVEATLAHLDHAYGMLNPPVDAALEKEFKDKRAQVRTLFTSGELDEALDQLDELGKLFDELAAAPGQGAAPQGLPPALGVRVFHEGDIEPHVVIRTPMGARRAGEPITFAVEPPGAVAGGSELEWDFGDGLTRRSKPDAPVEHRYEYAFDYSVRARARQGSSVLNDPQIRPVMLVVAASVGTNRVNALQRALVRVDWVTLAISVVLATVTGMLALYVDKPFGTISDYFTALLWGFGLDSTVRGFGTIFQKVSAPGAST